MQDFPNHGDVLSLASGTSQYSRHITITSCRLDDAGVQVRGELVDSRSDYETPEREIPVHGIVVRLTITTADLVISRAEIALPKTAFGEPCRAVPHSGEPLIGLSIGKEFLSRVQSIYGGDRSCYHIYSVLCAMHPTFMQVRHWNTSFPMMDEQMSAQAVPSAAGLMRSSMKNSCFAWREDGEVVRELDDGRYGPVLTRIAPRLWQRWQEQEQE